jgi:hypothetical protein
MFGTVPQAFHDLISRVIPGLTSILMIFMASEGYTESLRALHRWIDSAQQWNGWIISSIGVLVFVSAYVAGTMLRGLHVATEKLIGNFAPTKTNLTDSSSKSAATAFSSSSRLSLDQWTRFYDFVKFRDPSIGVRVTKLNAEASMAKVLLVTFVSSLVVLIIRFGVASPRPNLAESLCMAVFFLTGIVAAVVQRRNLEERRDRGVRNYAQLLGWCASAPLCWNHERLLGCKRSDSNDCPLFPVGGQDVKQQSTADP